MKTTQKIAAYFKNINHRVFSFIMVVCMSLFLLTGCETLRNYSPFQLASATLTTVSAAANLRYYYEDGRVLEFLDSVPLTEQEIDTILTALNEIDAVKKKLKVYEDTPAQLIQDIDFITLDYMRMKNAYVQIRTVVIQNFDSYSPQAQRAFVEFDASAVHLDKTVVELYKTASASESVRYVLAMADLAFKVAALL